MARLFGTDGVRGIANGDLTNELAYKLGNAGARVLAGAGEGKHKPLILVGRDTRLSGDMLGCALMAGICSAGAGAVDLGVITTPAIPMLVRKMNADAGVMISASHNPAKYNGIKFFDAKGFKLPDAMEDEIERLVYGGEAFAFPTGDGVGTITHDLTACREYMDMMKSALPLELGGVKVVLDCANGAASAIAPTLFTEMGATVCAVAAEPNGMNINDHCGSTAPQMLAQTVKRVGADIGLAFDGDADRLIAVDENGDIVDGDKMLVICGLHLKQKGELQNNTVVVTVMSNLGLTLAFKAHDVHVEKTVVGDRYVLENMVKYGNILGGEQSGHVIFSRYNTTGDGILTAMQLLKVMRETGKPLSELAAQMTQLPQVMVNVKVTAQGKQACLEDEELRSSIQKTEEQLCGEGRVLVRPSGTESLVRVMIEGKDKEQIAQMAAALAEQIRAKFA